MAREKSLVVQEGGRWTLERVREPLEEMMWVVMMRPGRTMVLVIMDSAGIRCLATMVRMEPAIRDRERE